MGSTSRSVRQASGGDRTAEPSVAVLDEKAAERIARALADRRRFFILREIAREPEISCGALAERFPIHQPTVSHHLRVLTDAGLLDSRKEGRHSRFRVRQDVLQAYLRSLRDELVDDAGAEPAAATDIAEAAAAPPSPARVPAPAVAGSRGRATGRRRALPGPPAGRLPRRRSRR